MIARRQERQPRDGGCGCRIALSDVVRALTETGVLMAYSAKRAEVVAAEMGLDTAHDWAGRPSVTRGDAATLRAELLRRRDAGRAAASQAARARDEAVRAGRERLLGGVQLNGKPV